MTRKKASGTISHKVNSNPEIVKPTILIHTYLVRLGGSGTRTKVYDNVRKERHLKSSPALNSGVRTRWNLNHLETSRASVNTSCLEIELRGVICPTGIDSDLYKFHRHNLGVVLPSIIDWDVYQKYESGINPLNRYYEFYQDAMVMFHNHLCEGRMAIEILSAQYFVMNDNLYLGMYERVDNIHKFPLNQLVDMEGFQLDIITIYRDKHDIINSIEREFPIAARDIYVRLGFSESVPVPVSDKNDVDCDLDEYLCVGLIYCT